ncbi:AP-3 complex subunit beta-1-like [Sycon ciliatum]|uniref:AP-3 complex subunit beta-1-like n=1 Tax=Sycon ciliatum TaxID=27933 RepID=UPI0031F6B183
MVACLPLCVNSFTEAGESRTVSIGVDFKDTLNPAVFDISCRTGKFSVKIPPIVGEIIQGAVVSEADFKQRSSQLKGMNESTGQATLKSAQEMHSLCQCVLHSAGLSLVQRSGNDGDDDSTLFFAGRTTSGHVTVLLRVAMDGTDVKLTCNCEKMVIGSMLLKEIKTAFANL